MSNDLRISITRDNVLALLTDPRPNLLVVNSLFGIAKNRLPAIDYPSLHNDIEVVTAHLSENTDSASNIKKIRKIVTRILFYLEVFRLNDNNAEAGKSICQKLSSFKDYYGLDEDLEPELRLFDTDKIDSFLRMLGWLLDHVNDKQFIISLIGLLIARKCSSEENINILVMNLSVLLPLIADDDQKKKFLKNIISCKEHKNLSILYSDPESLKELIKGVLSVDDSLHEYFEHLVKIYTGFFESNLKKIKELENDLQLFINFKFGNSASEYLTDKNKYLFQFLIGKEEGLDYKIFNCLKNTLELHEDHDHQFIFSILSFWSERIIKPEQILQLQNNLNYIFKVLFCKDQKKNFLINLSYSGKENIENFCNLDLGKFSYEDSRFKQFALQVPKIKKDINLMSTLKLFFDCFGSDNITDFEYLNYFIEPVSELENLLYDQSIKFLEKCHIDKNWISEAKNKFSVWNEYFFRTADERAVGWLSKLVQITQIEDEEQHLRFLSVLEFLIASRNSSKVIEYLVDGCLRPSNLDIFPSGLDKNDENCCMVFRHAIKYINAERRSAFLESFLPYLNLQKEKQVEQLGEFSESSTERCEVKEGKVEPVIFDYEGFQTLKISYINYEENFICSNEAKNLSRLEQKISRLESEVLGKNGNIIQFLSYEKSLLENSKNLYSVMEFLLKFRFNPSLNIEIIKNVLKKIPLKNEKYTRILELINLAINEIPFSYRNDFLLKFSDYFVEERKSQLPNLKNLELQAELKKPLKKLSTYERYKKLMLSVYRNLKDNSQDAKIFDKKDSFYIQKAAKGVLEDTLNKDLVDQMAWIRIWKKSQTHPDVSIRVKFYSVYEFLLNFRENNTLLELIEQKIENPNLSITHEFYWPVLDILDEIFSNPAIQPKFYCKIIDVFYSLFSFMKNDKKYLLINDSESKKTDDKDDEQVEISITEQQLERLEEITYTDLLILEEQGDSTKVEGKKNVKHESSSEIKKDEKLLTLGSLSQVGANINTSSSESCKSKQKKLVELVRKFKFKLHPRVKSFICCSNCGIRYRLDVERQTNLEHDILFNKKHNIPEMFLTLINDTDYFKVIKNFKKSKDIDIHIASVMMNQKKYILQALFSKDYLYHFSLIEDKTNLIEVNRKNDLRNIASKVNELNSKFEGLDLNYKISATGQISFDHYHNDELVEFSIFKLKR